MVRPRILPFGVRRSQKHPQDTSSLCRKRIMDAKRLCAALATVFLLHSSALAQTWTDDYAAAKVAARDGDRAVFLFFTGSDWCGWCKKLDREILSTPEFAAFAGQNLVLVKVDFPRSAPLPPAQANRNRALSQGYRVEGFPTVIVLAKYGRVDVRLGYIEGGPWAVLAGNEITFWNQLPVVRYFARG